MKFEMDGRDLDRGLLAIGLTMEAASLYWSMVSQGPRTVGSIVPLARLNGLGSHDVELIMDRRMLFGDLYREGVT